MAKIILFTVILILLIIPSAYAAEYSSEKYGCGLYGQGCAEAPSGSAATTSGGSGGAAIAGPEIIVEPTELNVRLAVNTNKEYIIKVTNSASSKKTLSVRQSNLDNMVILTGTSLEIEAGETKELRVIFVALNETGIFTGKIHIGSKEVLVSLNIRTKLLLFDSNIIVLNENYIIRQGDKLKTTVNLIPKGEKERLDITLNYVIKDYEGKIYLTKSETLLVEEQVNFERNFDIGMLPIGKYIIGLELVYLDGVAPSSAYFEVIEKKEKLLPSPLKQIPSQTWIIIGIFGLFVVILVVILWKQKGLKEQLQTMKKQIVKSRTKEDVKKEITRVKKDLDALETTYKDELITESSYKGNKKKLNMKLEKLREELASKERAPEKVKEKPETNKKKLKKLRYKRNKLKKELNSLQKAYNMGVIDKEGYKKTKKETENRIKNIETRLKG